MYKTMDIMFDDLNDETQERVLEFHNVESSSDLNADIVPLCVLTAEEESDK